MNEFADWYDTSSARDWPLSRIESEGGLGRDDIRDVPYGRGALYCADLDLKIRDHSHGSRSLNQVVNPIFMARQHGTVFNQAAWGGMLLRELGSDAVSQFRSMMIEGTRELIPPSSVFGPCLQSERLTLKVRETDSLVERYEWKQSVGTPGRRCS